MQACDADGTQLFRKVKLASAGNPHRLVIKAASPTAGRLQCLCNAQPEGHLLASGLRQAAAQPRTASVHDGAAAKVRVRYADPLSRCKQLTPAACTC